MASDFAILWYIRVKIVRGKALCVVLQKCKIVKAQECSVAAILSIRNASNHFLNHFSSITTQHACIRFVPLKLHDCTACAILVLHHRTCTP